MSRHPQNSHRTLTGLKLQFPGLMSLVFSSLRGPLFNRNCFHGAIHVILTHFVLYALLQVITISRNSVILDCLWCVPEEQPQCKSSPLRKEIQDVALMCVCVSECERETRVLHACIRVGVRVCVCVCGPLSEVENYF